MSPDSLSGGQTGGAERYGAAHSSFRSRGSGMEGEHRNGSVATFDAPVEKPRLPSLDPQAPPEPVFPATDWLDSDESGSLADHPLLRGLLLELPPRGSVPPPGWLDRWFEATRSILELLYVR